MNPEIAAVTVHRLLISVHTFFISSHVLYDCCQNVIYRVIDNIREIER